MKHVKLFEQFLSELNETVYQLGFDGSGMYASRGDSRVKSKTLALLKSGKWMKTESGKWAVEEGKRLADMWNSKDRSAWPIWLKSYPMDKDGKLNTKGFINKTAVIVAVLDEISKREKATADPDKGAHRFCFGNSADWSKKNGGQAIGGICMRQDATKFYSPESLVVHAFVKKSGKYYDVTVAPGIVTSLIYWPLITFDDADEMKIAKDTWSYALGIEEAVEEYIGFSEKYL